MSISPIPHSLFTNNSVARTRDAGAGDISGAVAQATGDQTLGQNAFLKLLSTQLSNQDPTSPQDDSQFLAQLAQFSTVQGVTNLQSSQTHLQASELIGKTVNASVIVNNQAQNLSGKVSSVRWDSAGVHLRLNDASQSEVTLDQVSQVSN